MRRLSSVYPLIFLFLLTLIPISFVAHTVRRPDPVRPSVFTGHTPPPQPALNSPQRAPTEAYYSPNEYNSENYDSFNDYGAKEADSRPPISRAEQIGGHFVQPQRTSAALSDRMEMVQNDEVRLKKRLKLYGLRVKKEIVGDGNCQFAALADQLFDDTSLHYRPLFFIFP